MSPRKQKTYRRQRRHSRKYNKTKKQRGGAIHITSDEIAAIFKTKFLDQPYKEVGKPKYGEAVAVDNSSRNRMTGEITTLDFSITLDKIPYRATKTLGTGITATVYAIERQDSSPIMKKSRSSSATEATVLETGLETVTRLLFPTDVPEQRALPKTPAEASSRSDRTSPPPPTPQQSPRARASSSSSTTQPSGLKALKQIKMFNMLNTAIENYKQYLDANAADITITEEQLKENIKNIVANQLDVFLNEINMLQKLKLYCAEYFLCYDSVYFEQGEQVFNIYIVTEHLEGEELFNYVLDKYNNTPSIPIPHATIYKIMNDIVNGIVGLHELGLTHGDIKPENIYLIKDADGNIVKAKIIDFGMCKQIQENALYPFTGTPNYMIPEVLYRRCSMDGISLKLIDLWGAALIGLLLHNTLVFSSIQGEIAESYDMTRPPETEEKAWKRINDFYNLFSDYLECEQPELRNQYIWSMQYNQFIKTGYENKVFIIDLRKFLEAYFNEELENEEKYNFVLQYPKQNLPKNWRRFPRVRVATAVDESIIGGETWKNNIYWTKPIQTCNPQKTTILISETGKIAAVNSKSKSVPKKSMNETWTTLDL